MCNNKQTRERERKKKKVGKPQSVLQLLYHVQGVRLSQGTSGASFQVASRTKTPVAQCMSGPNHKPSQPVRRPAPVQLGLLPEASDKRGWRHCCCVDAIVHPPESSSEKREREATESSGLSVAVPHHTTTEGGEKRRHLQGAPASWMGRGDTHTHVHIRLEPLPALGKPQGGARDGGRFRLGGSMVMWLVMMVVGGGNGW